MKRNIISKVIVMTLSFLMVLAMNVSFVSAAGTIKFSAVGGTVSVGNTIDVTVNETGAAVNSASKIATFTTKLLYDSTAFEVVSVTKGTVVPVPADLTIDYSTAGKVNFFYGNGDGADTSNVSTDGVIATVKLKAKTDAVLKDYSLVIDPTISVAGDTSLITNPHTVTVQNATVTVKAAPVAVTGVVNTPATVVLNPTGTKQLTATVAPANADVATTTYTSDNTAAATVDANGKVTAVAQGTATITTTVKDTQGNVKTATSTVVVLPTSASVAEGATLQLPAVPGITWTAYGDGIVSVSNGGLVTGLKQGGPVNVTATVEGQTIATAVTVTEKAVDANNFYEINNLTINNNWVKFNVKQNKANANACIVVQAKDSNGSVIGLTSFTATAGDAKVFFSKSIAKVQVWVSGAEITTTNDPASTTVISNAGTVQTK